MPQIEEANKKLEEEIKVTGKNDKQIDVDLLVQEEGGDSAAATASTNEDQADDKTVKIEFALGDFDNTPIAAMEDSKREVGSGDEEEEEEEVDGPDRLVLKTSR